MINLKILFDNRFENIKFNKKLAQEFYHFQIKFITKNQEYIEFFGGNLTGVHIIKFTPSDESDFFDILETNKEEIKYIVDKDPGINKNFVVSSDPLNLFISYCIHRSLTSNFLTDKDKKDAVLNLALILNYKFITSIMSHFFRYPIDKATAEVVYNNLSFKYLLKQKGTWSETLQYRAEEMTASNSIHYEALKSFNDDQKIVYFLNDSQGRIRDMMKNIYREFLRVKESGVDKYVKTSHVQLDEENGDSFKDYTKGIEIYKNYLFNVLQNENDYIKEELVKIILNIVQNIERANLISLLEYTVDNHLKKNYIEEYLNTIIVYSYNQMKNDIDIINSKDIGKFLTILKAYYQSSKNKDPDLLEIRKLGDKLVTECLDFKTRITVTSLRTAHFLYTVLRTYTKDYYS